MLRTVEWSASKPQSKIVTKFLERSAFPEEAEKAASVVLAAIRKDGDAAVARYVAKFEGAKLTPKAFRVSEADLSAAEDQVEPKIKQAVQDAYRRVLRFSKASLRKSWEIKTTKGGTEGEFFTPMDRVGVYVPGGTAPLASTSVMTVTLAAAAGVKEIVACTPAGPTGTPNPVLLYALKLAGATEIYRVGGIQAIGLMAFGTKTVRKVQKIVGPGNAFVTAAKRQVFGYVGIDQVAGPSEIAVLADGTVNPAWVAADLLSQAEHGSDSQVMLVCSSSDFAAKVEAEVAAQSAQLDRIAFVEGALSKSRIIVMESQEDQIEFANTYAPEHLIVSTSDPWSIVDRITASGSVFVGSFTPESAGDYASGTNHTLPTCGWARSFSGVNIDSYMRKMTIQEISREGLEGLAQTIVTMAEAEGLSAHANAVKVRIK